jgi:hypothetical protein
MSDRTSPRTAIHPGLDDGVAYPGGKGVSGLAPWICDRLPSHVYYGTDLLGSL